MAHERQEADARCGCELAHGSLALLNGTRIMLARTFRRARCVVTPVCLWLAGALTAVAEDWPQLQHDAARTGHSAVSVIPGHRARWVWVDEEHVTRDFRSRRGASIKYPNPRTVILAGDVQPIVAQNAVFFGACNGEFYALRAADGSTLWKARLGGPILHTAGWVRGTVVTGCMDGKLYAFNANTGERRWEFQAGAGFSVAPLIVGEAVYAGSRDGTFYAIDASRGELRWKYRTVADAPEHPHSGAPIMQSAASDGERIFFGAENMFFYALEARTGQELWRKKLGGQSFMYSWPVVHQGVVMTFTMVPDGLSEFKIEAELDALPARSEHETRTAYAERVWPAERAAIRLWLRENPAYRNFYVMRAADGASPYAEEVPMGRVGGIGYPGRAPVVDGQGRVLLYWRTRSAVLLTGGTFGTKYTPDLGTLDLASGDRGWFRFSSPMGAEIDNNFTLTVGGDCVYLNNHMRGAHCISLADGACTRATSILAVWDGANFRDWGNRLIWVGNDADPTRVPPASIHRSPQGECGVVLATIEGRPTMFIQESGHYQIDFGCLAAVEAQP